MKRKTKLDRQIDFIKVCLLVVAVLLVIFTAVIITIFKETGCEPSTLITCFFATFSFEIIGCVLIKIFKLKFPSKKEDNDNDCSG